MTSISTHPEITVTPTEPQPMLTLDDADARSASIVGAKAAGLAALRGAGFNVPDAHILPVGIAHRWPGGGPPTSVRAAVVSACAALGERIAVRTSATWEDGASKAHAGATTTVLDVGGVDAVLDAIRTCLDESAATAARNGIDGELAIVIQSMVPADWAGVAFSADPLTGDRDVVRIAATEGLGESLVQGDVVGDDLAVRGDVIESGSTELPRSKVLEVAQTTRAVEKALGRPQDVEWAIADGQLHLLQARPITVLPIEPTYPEGNNWQKDVAHYPEPMTPFGWSLMQELFADVPKVFDDMGLLVRGLEEVSVGGEIYGRVKPAFGSANAASAPPPAPVLGLVARIAPPLRRRTAMARAAVDGRKAQRWLESWLSHDRAEALKLNEKLEITDLAELDDVALARHVDTLLAAGRTGMRTHFELMMALARSLYRLHQFVEQELGWDDATMMSMFVGHSPATSAAHEALASIRTRLGSNEEIAAAIATSPGTLMTVLAERDPALVRELQAWIDEHGWAMINYDAGVPVLAERPLVLAQLVLNDVSIDEDGSATQTIEKARSQLTGDRLAEFDDLFAEAMVVYPVREDNTIILGDRRMAMARRWMLEGSRRLAERGALNSAADGAYLTVDEVRSSLMGDSSSESLDALVVHRRGEEAWVRANPGPLYIGKQGAPPDTSRLPAPLREANEPILWMIGHEYPTPIEPPAGQDVLLTGVAAAGGYAEGTVRVIRSHDEIDRLRQGDVLVCQVTSPAWAPLFPLASAIVADGGGVLSHAAIAAREHGIPAVLGTGTGMAELVDGQRVIVDGTRGLVLAIE